MNRLYLLACPTEGGTLKSRVRAMRQERLHTKARERLKVVDTGTDGGLGLPSEARGGCKCGTGGFRPM